MVSEATCQAEDTKENIILGKNSSNIPCKIFLLGAQMMRQYMYEMISYMIISGMINASRGSKGEISGP